MRKLLSIVAILTLTVGCNKRSADTVTMVAANDPRMNAAIDKARATIGTFINALKSPKPNQTTFTVKMAFSDGKQTEHMWLSPVSYNGKTFEGTVNNDAELVSNVKIGQSVSVEPSRISDWMYVEDGKLVGGYTLRVLRDAMSAKERREFDKSIPFVVD